MDKDTYDKYDKLLIAINEEEFIIDKYLRIMEALRKDQATRNQTK